MIHQRGFYSDLNQKRSGYVTKYRNQWAEVLSDVAEASTEAFAGAGDLTTGRAKAFAALRNHRDEYQPVLRDNTLDVATVWSGEVLEHLKTQRSVPADPIYLIVGRKDPQGEEAGKQAATQHLEDEAAELVQKIHDGTRKQLQAILKTVFDEDLSHADAIKRMRSAWPGLTRARARRIARTETIRASGIGVEAAGRDAAFGVQYEWMATTDDRTRATHLAVDGVTRTPDGFFNVGGYEAKHPADTRLPPAEAVNCRCALAAVPL